MHRDLKLENIIIAEKNSKLVKIVDFGIAGLANNLNLESIDVGSLKYMAPETLTGRSKKIGPSFDIWALGVILYALVFDIVIYIICINQITGSLPFDGKSYNEIKFNIISANYSFPTDLELSMEIKDLISRIFIIDMNKRIKMIDILSHPWI